MIIIKVWGGLGNQMFQVALGLSLTSKGYMVKYDKNWLYQHKETIGENIIDEVFNIQIQEADETEISSVKKESTNLIIKGGRKLGILKRHYLFEPESYRGEYKSKIMKRSDNMYLEGYWQAEEYFKDIKEEIYNAYQWKRHISNESNDWYNQIKNEKQSVSVHVRLGDYNKPENIKTIGGICNSTYYKKAFEYIEGKVNNPKYFLFSNEPEKAMEILGDRSCKIIDCNTSLNGWNDMFLMSVCSHNIIANSSFSWWGAYLNQFPQKIVIMPDQWTNDSVRKGMYVSGWKKMEF